MPPILIWHYEDAPPEYKQIGNRGGDEDWIAFVPNEVQEGRGVPFWLQIYGPFGPTWERRVEGGYLYVGTHA